MAWSLLKEAALRSLVEKGVPYQKALEIGQASENDVLIKKDAILREYREAQADKAGDGA